jgi:PhnB protein
MSSVAPAGYTSVAPWIVTTDTGRLLEFIATAFDGEELARIPLEDGSIGHAEIRVGDTVCSRSTSAPTGRRSPRSCACS